MLLYAEKEKAMKHIANMLTGLRIVLSLLIPAFLDDRTAVFILFVAAGLTDLLDGIIARRTGTVSRLGAKLDSAADIVMFGVMIAYAVVWAGVALWALAPWLIAVAAVRTGNLLIVGLKFKTFAGIHTLGNKLTGVLILVAFGVYILADSLAALIPSIAVAGLSTIEETLILLTSQTLDLDRKSLFIKAGRRNCISI